MPLYKVIHSAHGNLGSSKDWYTNTFHIYHPTQVLDSDANLAYSAGVATMIKNFYNGRDNSVAGIVDYLSPRVTVERTIKIYDTAGAPPHPPLYVEDFFGNPDVPDLLSLPEEVACCLSYTGTTTSTPAARRRGRIYIGPLNISAIDDVLGGSNPVQVVGQFVQALLSQAVGLAAALNSGGYSWRVYSKTNNASYDIVQFQVDDAFDTIRNRGTASVTGRQTADVA